MGAAARVRSLQAARRITENLRYAAAIAELAPRPPRVVRMRTFAGPLPGFYAAEATKT